MRLLRTTAIHTVRPTNFHDFPKDLLPRTVFSPVLRFLFFLWFGVAVCAAAPLRVAVFAPEDSGLAALVAAKVSKIRGVKAFRRGQIHLLPGEQIATDSESGRRALGRVLAADILLVVDAGRNAFGFIDAQTGEELFRIREDNPEWLVRSAVALVQEQSDVQTVRLTVVIVLENRGADRVKRDYFLTDFSTQSMKAFGPPAR